MAYDDDFEWKPYVPVAARRRQAERRLAAAGTRREEAAYAFNGRRAPKLSNIGERQSSVGPISVRLTTND